MKVDIGKYLAREISKRSSKSPASSCQRYTVHLNKQVCGAPNHAPGNWQNVGWVDKVSQIKK